MKEESYERSWEGRRKKGGRKEEIKLQMICR
jgi:hypothetical protein